MNSDSADLDLRQQRTREALYNALVELLEQKPYDEITIADLTRQAKVARPTFYLHFKDIHEVLLTRLEEDLRAQQALVSELTPDYETVLDDRITLLRFAFERVAANAQLYHLILTGRAGPVVYNLFYQQITTLHRRVLKARGLEDSGIMVNLINGYFSGAIGGILSAWLEAGMPNSPEEMTRLVIELMDGTWLDTCSPLSP